MKCALLFDMDGTIVDNMTFHVASWGEFFQRRNMPYDECEFSLQTTGRKNVDIMRNYIDPALSDVECHALSNEKDVIYRELYRPHRQTIPGLIRLLSSAMASGIPLAVATSAQAENIQFILDEMDLRRYFTTVVGAADVQKGKPEPDVFLSAAVRCGVAPQDCLVFEDSLLGIEAARRAGMHTVALTTTFPPETFTPFDNVVTIVSDFNQFRLEDFVNTHPLPHRW